MTNHPRMATAAAITLMTAALVGVAWQAWIFSAKPTRPPAVTAAEHFGAEQPSRMIH